LNGRHVTARGVELNYELRGEGPTVTLVSSFFMPASGWGVFTNELSTSNRLLTYDLGPGGWSSVEVADFDSYVADLDELLDVLGVERTYLVAHSSGTQICTAYAAAHPDRVAGLVLVGPLVNPTGGPRRREMVDAWRSAYLEGGFGALFDSLWWLVHSESTLKRAGAIGRKLMRRRFVQLNEGSNPLPLFALSDTHQVEFAVDWEALTMPALLLTGEDDCVATASAVRETQGLMPGSEVVKVPNAGHILYLEANDAFQEEVQRFLDRVERGRGVSAAVAS
jgi:pimeloyl-ACP methyl ester carboxylesterase